MNLTGLDHVQLAMPAGAEDAAVAFYAGVLGLTEVPKPAALAGRGGVWFAGPGIALHLGTDSPFAPAKKAHPAFTVASLAAARAHLDMHGITWTDGGALPGLVRLYVADPFGNRIEILERTAPDGTVDASGGSI